MLIYVYNVSIIPEYLCVPKIPKILPRPPRTAGPRPAGRRDIESRAHMHNSAQQRRAYVLLPATLLLAAVTKLI